MKNKKNILLIISLVLSFRALTASPTCGHDHGAAPSTENAALSLRVQASKDSYISLKLKDVEVEKKRISENVQALGQMENIPERSYEISSRIAGKVVELYLSLGDEVKKGQAIAKVESLLAGDPPPSIILTAPADGIIEILEITNGSPIEANTTLARIVDSKKIYAVANVFEDDFASLKLGQEASIRVLGDKFYSAKLKKFSTMANGNTNTIAVYFELDNPNLELKQNMRASFNIEISKEEESLVVPISAIGGNFPNHYVFVQECAEDLIYQKVEVAIGKKDDKYIQILSSLKEGDIVACNNIYQLQFLPAASGESTYEHSHEHSDFEPMALTHSHCNDEEHSFKQECFDKFIEFKDFMSALRESEYFNTVIYIAFAISLLLNLFFIRGEFRSKKDGDKQ